MNVIVIIVNSDVLARGQRPAGGEHRTRHDVVGDICDVQGVSDPRADQHPLRRDDAIGAGSESDGEKRAQGDGCEVPGIERVQRVVAGGSKVRVVVGCDTQTGRGAWSYTEEEADCC